MLDQPKQLSLADGMREWYKRLTCRGEIIMILTKAIFIVKDWITMLRKDKRCACEQKAATVLPNRTAAT